MINEAHALAYTGLTLNRDAPNRTNEAWLTAARTAPGARALAFYGNRCAIKDGAPLTVAVTPDAVYLGSDHAPLFAIDLTDEPNETADIRTLYPRLPNEDATRLAYARGLLHWHRTQRFCGTCGNPANPHHGGHLRICTGCQKELYPRIEPAIIVLVEHNDRALLARHRGATAYSTLAGFVEIGESLEDAVRREVAEESGVVVNEVDYAGSQAWPFPAGLMVGFHAHAADDRIHVDGDELDEARWFTREEVAAMGDRRPDSIENFLVTAWLSRA